MDVPYVVGQLLLGLGATVDQKVELDVQLNEEPVLGIP